MLTPSRPQVPGFCLDWKEENAHQPALPPELSLSRKLVSLLGLALEESSHGANMGTFWPLSSSLLAVAIRFLAGRSAGARTPEWVVQLGFLLPGRRTAITKAGAGLACPTRSWPGEMVLDTEGSKCRELELTEVEGA